VTVSLDRGESYREGLRAIDFNVVSSLGAQTRAHKGKPISMGDTNLGGHRIIYIVPLQLKSASMRRCLNV
jgi:hypothetical protein